MIKRLFTAAVLSIMLTNLIGCRNMAADKINEYPDNQKPGSAGIVYLCDDPEEYKRNADKFPVMAAAIKRYEEKYNSRITFIYSPWMEKQSKLEVMMAAGTPPDIYAPIDGFPQFAINGYAQPINELINIKDPIWKDVKDAYDAIEWKGKHHFVVTNSGGLDVVWYNKKIFSENNIETPYELYKKGEWNWNTFRDLAIRLTQDTNNDGIIDQWGFSCAGSEALILTTGNDLIKFNGSAGTMENNLKHTDVLNALTFFRQAGAAGYNIIQPNMNDYQEDFACGKIAMHIGAIWSDVVWWKNLMLNGGCSFVPAPKYPDSDEYYVGGFADLWMIPKGASNTEGASAFLTELRKAEIDPEVKKITREGDAVHRGWREQEFEMQEELHKLKFVYCFFAGVGSLGNVRYSLWYDLRVVGEPVHEAIEKHFDLWSKEIDIAKGYTITARKEASALQGRPEIDGEIDDIWERARILPADQEKTTPDVATAKIRALYDENTLYVLAEVSDTKVMAEGPSPWESDSVEIFIDENKTQGNYYDDNTVQIRVDADGAVTGAGPAWEERKFAVTSAVNAADGGYVVEIAYKFKEIKAKPGGSIGFNVSINDQEKAGVRKGTAVWNPDGGISYHNPSRFGVIHFK